MESEYSVADFEIIEGLPKTPKELTSQTLFDLFDIAIKWGHLGESEMLKFPAFENEEYGFLIAVSPLSTTISIFVVKEFKLGKNFCAPDEGIFTFKIKGGSSVIWDKRISIEEAVAVIKKVDEIAKEKGLTDSETGERVCDRYRGVEGVALKASLN